ncbi:MAG: hypothetical protein ACKOE8_07245 [Opitutaceae bacterium]
MKTAPLLLATSLAVNAALVVFVVKRDSAKPPASAKPSAPAATAPAPDAALRAALASGDTAALTAAGAPASLVRELALGRRLSALSAQAPAGTTDPRWWRGAKPGAPVTEERARWRREVTEALAAAGIDPKGVFGPGDPGLLSFLPPAKREALRRINQDYEELTAKFGANGVQLSSDRERLKLLRAERERDIAALFTPEEYAEFTMRTSPSSSVVRARYGDAIESEAEFRRIYELQRAFDEKFPMENAKARATPEGMRAFADAQRQLQDDIRAAVGDTAWSRLQRAADSDLGTVDSLVNRLNLPPATTDRIASLRETLAAESQRINADSAASAPQRRAKIQELAARAKSELTAALGQEGSEAYGQRSPWMGMLAGGLAFSTTPPANGPGAALSIGGQSVYPVLPTGAPGAIGGARQVMISAESTLSTDATVGGPRENVRVMTFSTGEGNPAVTVGGGGGATIIVAPPTNPPASPPGR